MHVQVCVYVCVGILSATLKQPQCANLHSGTHTLVHICIYVHVYVCTYVYSARTSLTHTLTLTYTVQTQYFLKYYMHKCLFLYSVLYVCVTRRLCVLDSVSRLILSLKLVDCRRRCPRRGILLLLLPVANYGPAQCWESSPIPLSSSLSFSLSLYALCDNDCSRIHFN